MSEDRACIIALPDGRHLVGVLHPDMTFTQDLGVVPESLFLLPGREPWRRRARRALAAFWRYKVLRRDPWAGWTEIGATSDPGERL